VKRRFEGTPASVGASRRFAAEVIADLPPDVRAAVLLMVSELTTNAVLHAAGGYEVSIDTVSAKVDVFVTDFGGQCRSSARRTPTSLTVEDCRS